MKKLLNKNTIVLLDQAVFSGGSFLITIMIIIYLIGYLIISFKISNDFRLQYKKNI